VSLTQTKEQFAEDLKRAYANATGGMKKRNPDIVLFAPDVWQRLQEMVCDATGEGRKVLDSEGRVRIGNAYAVKAESLPEGRIIFAKILHTEQ